MLIVGLTGSIGMGKSTAAAQFRARGVPVFDADAEVHALYASKAAVAIVEKAFPGTTTPKGVDRDMLSAALAADPDGFQRLEAIVHPMIRDSQLGFVHHNHAAGASMVVLEIPLLFEAGLDREVDVVVVVSSSVDVQRQRVLARPNMTPQKFETILTRQRPDAEKRRLAHFVVDTNGDPATCARQIDAILGAISSRPARAYAARST